MLTNMGVYGGWVAYVEADFLPRFLNRRLTSDLLTYQAEKTTIGNVSLSS